ncbi:MAG TPA: type II toxin-antitoxin system HicB family antitoxin [Treponemataceae bacterium]|nr:type II toxin-antitoxin system HicB family antitoxin [Treponemataceae bacterium]
MKAEFTAILEKASEGGFWAICPEIPGANGQGETIEEAKTNLREEIIKHGCIICSLRSSQRPKINTDSVYRYG